MNGIACAEQVGGVLRSCGTSARGNYDGNRTAYADFGEMYAYMFASDNGVEHFVTSLCLTGADVMQAVVSL